MSKWDHKDPRFKDDQWIIYHYKELNWPIKQIAKELDYSEGSISDKLFKLGLRNRKLGPDAARQKYSSDPRINDKDWLRNQYITLEWSIKDIVEICNSSYSTIRAKLMEFNIDRRPHGDTARSRIKKSINNATLRGPANHRYGTHISEEHKHAISNAVSGKKNPMYGKPPSPKSSHGKSSYFYHPDGRQIWLRSSYDLRVARALTDLDVTWYYEVDRFQLSNKETYTPDFYLPMYDVWWEVKGYWREEAKQKMLKVFKIYPEIKLRILYNDNIKELEFYAQRGEQMDYNEIGISIKDLVNSWRN